MTPLLALLAVASEDKSTALVIGIGFFAIAACLVVLGFWVGRRRDE